jgi:hypothetical protein
MNAASIIRNSGSDPAKVRRTRSSWWLEIEMPLPNFGKPRGEVGFSSGLNTLSTFRISAQPVRALRNKEIHVISDAIAKLVADNPHTI